MTGLIRSRGNSGAGTKLRRCAKDAAVAASFTLFASGAIAQTPGTAGPVSLNEVFQGEESDDLTPEGAQKIRDAAQRARAQGNCPKGTFTVVVKKGDDLFQQARAQARRDVILQILGDQARNFVTGIDITGARNDVRVSYGAPRDNIAPKLEVTWTPPKNTKVKPHDRITAKVIARDDTNDWQTGIKTIDLNVRGGGSFGFEDYPQPPQTCERPPPPRTLDGVYTVPANPPPLVRLTVVARDYAGNETDVWADFPTGDWYGSVTWSETLINVPSRTPTRYWGRLDFTANYDGRGNLTGKAVSIEDFEGSESAGLRCDTKTTKPTDLEVSLTGSYTPGTNTLSLFADPMSVKYVIGELSYNCNSPTHAFGRLDPVIRPELNEIMRNLGLVNGEHAEVTRDWNPASNGIGALHMELKVHRARN